MRWSWTLICAALLMGAAGALVSAEETDDPAGIEFFERKVRPLLARRCYECHSSHAKSLQGGLYLDTRAGVLQGGDSGPAVVPGKPEASLLVTALHFGDDLQMPPEGKIPAEEIALVTEWVRRGAPMPPDREPAPQSRSQIDWDEARRFWSFQPLRSTPLPTVQNAMWPQRRIDFFVLSELEKHQWTPSGEADRRTLVRRVTFDLIGLPPTPEEIEAFLADPEPDAYERLVDRLLASPHYGERWGRYWLDLARYTDQTASWLNSTAHAWLYRDWVVQAFNEDRPYDEFVRLQLAADLIEGVAPTDLAALGFLGLSPTYWKELKLAPNVIKTVVAEEWEERIDAISRTFLGLTVACARCHDHKYDPITTHDYYALAGVLASTRLADRFMLPPEEAQRVQAARAEVANLEAEIAKLRKAQDGNEAAVQKANELQARVEEIRRSTPHYDALQVCAVDEASIEVLPDGPNATRIEYHPGQPLDLHVQVRGEPSNEGPLAPRRFLRVFYESDPPLFRHGSGRRELADALVNEAAPLAARVIVNRVWRHHFGRGLVDTPSDFGLQGSRPTHPELLDDLAARFVQNGWSLKWLHREILLSATYKQTSMTDRRLPTVGYGQNADQSAEQRQTASDPQRVDPENRLLWRMNRRRLEFEPWRDAMLAVAGSLDARFGGVALPLTEANHRRRTIYSRIHRHELDVTLRLYDFPDPSSHSPSREATTTPLQGLFVLNGPFVQQQAAALVERLKRESPDDLVARVDRAYWLLFGRAPQPAEVELAREFLSADAASDKAWRLYVQALLGANEFMFVD